MLTKEILIFRCRFFISGSDDWARPVGPTEKSEQNAIKTLLDY